MSQSHPPSEELFAYRDGELDAERRGLIEAHVLSCTACQARIDALSDAEGVLREQSGDPEAAYLDRLTDAVMARVAKEPAPGGAAVPGAAAPGPSRERPGRRRNFEDGPRGRAPGLPWPAILSTASAAAAVVVVVVLLIQRPDAWRAAPRVAQTPLPGEADGGRAGAPPAAKEESAPPAERENAASGDVAADAAGPGSAAPESPAASAGNELLAEGRASAAARAPSEGQIGFKQRAVADEQADPALADLAAGAPVGRARTDGVRTQSASEALSEGRLAAEEKDADAPAKITGGVAPLRQGASRDEAPSSEPAGPTYAGVVARHGLPPLYDPLRVRPEALLRAEPDLRLLYRTGGAGADSARTRIYLAEAARARAGENLDVETFDAIVHHYRRALQLARDPATARIARQRLEDFVSRSAPNR